MLAFRQRAVRCAARPVTQRAVCRYSTGQQGKEGDEVKHFAGSSTEHGHQHAGPKNESLGVRSIGFESVELLTCFRFNCISSSHSSPQPTHCIFCRGRQKMAQDLVSLRSSTATHPIRSSGQLGTLCTQL